MDDNDGCLPVIIFFVIIFFVVRSCMKDPEPEVKGGVDVTLETIMNTGQPEQVLTIGVPSEQKLERDAVELDNASEKLDKDVKALEFQLKEYEGAD